jgi:hypothetical protein
VSCAVCDKKSTDCITLCNEACGNAIKYQPRKDRIEGDFIVISDLMENTRYRFTLSVTEPDDESSYAYQSNTSVACVTTRSTKHIPGIGGKW